MWSEKKEGKKKKDIDSSVSVKDLFPRWLKRHWLQKLEKSARTVEWRVDWADASLLETLQHLCYCLHTFMYMYYKVQKIMYIHPIFYSIFSLIKEFNNYYFGVLLMSLQKTDAELTKKQWASNLLIIYCFWCISFC